MVELWLSLLGNKEGRKKETDEQIEKQALFNLQIGSSQIQSKRAVTTLGSLPRVVGL